MLSLLHPHVEKQAQTPTTMSPSQITGSSGSITSATTVMPPVGVHRDPNRSPESPACTLACTLWVTRYRPKEPLGSPWGAEGIGSITALRGSGYIAAFMPCSGCGERERSGERRLFLPPSLEGRQQGRVSGNMAGSRREGVRLILLSLHLPKIHIFQSGDAAVLLVSVRGFVN